MIDLEARGFPDFDPAAFPEGAWIVPIELVLTARTQSIYPGVVRQRASRQDWPYPDALVFIQGKRFFAEVRFRGDAPARQLLWELDLWPVENLVEAPGRVRKS